MKRQIDIKLDGVPWTVYSYPKWDKQNPDGSYNLDNNTFAKVKDQMNDINKWEIVEIPDILAKVNESGATTLSCPYCTQTFETADLKVLNMHIGRFHADKKDEKLIAPTK